MFYLYQHIRPDTGAIFYVGKGSKNRSRSRSSRSNHWKSIVAKAGGFTAEIVFRDEDEELIFLAEEERIDQLKRLGYALANQTDGGKGGTKGHRHSEETRQKIAEKMKGKLAGSKHPRYGLFGKDNPMYGRKQSDSARHGMSINCAMKRQEVAAKISGERSLKAKSVEYQGKAYGTMVDLANHLGISAQALRSRIFRGQAEKYGYKVLGFTRMVAKDFMADQDLAPLNAAINA